MTWIERPIELFFELGPRPTLDEILGPLEPWMDLIGRLEATEQDSEWHGEGDVRTHTKMVLEELYEVLDSGPNPLSPEDRAVLVLGAALHDIAKPLVTRRAEIDGHERIVAPRHADLGRSYLAPRLIRLPWPFERIWQVMSLVGHHHDPLKWVRTDAEIGAYRRLARAAPIRDLVRLETADLRGRICPDLDDQLEQLELFAMAAEEVGEPPDHLAWHDPLEEMLVNEPDRVRRLGYLQAIYDAEAGRVRSVEEAAARSYTFRRPTGELVLLCGPSGSGKTTWIEAHHQEAVVISLDSLRDAMGGRCRQKKVEGQVVQEGLKQLKVALARHETVIWDATNLRREHRRELVNLAEAYGAIVTLVTFLLSSDELHARNRRRAHQVPDQALDHQIRRFDLPYPFEAHELVIVNSDGERLARFP